MENMNSREPEQEAAQARISHRISSVFFGLIAGLSALMTVAVLATSGGSSPPAAAVAAKPVAQTVTVGMHDPGCHWFQVNGDFKKSMTVTGPVKLLNSDEAALKVAQGKTVKTAAMGKKLALNPGSYKITMVGQAPDDNTLSLTVD